MNPNKPSREAFLDGLRFLAAFAVVLFHYGFYGYAAGPFFLTISFPMLSSFARYGYLGVQIFFMISGYVILWSLEGRSVAQFAAHRFIRLYPTFWLCASLTLLIEGVTGSTRFYPSVLGDLANITMIPQWLGFREIDGAYWSLAAELQFYILVAFLTGILGFRRLAEGLTAWLVVSIGLYESGHGFAGGHYSSCFCVGAASYMLHRDGYRAKLVVLFAGSVLASVLLSMTQAESKALEYGTKFSPAVCAAILLLSAALIYFSKRISGLMGERTSRISLFLGGLTYPLYLLHQNAGYSIMDTYFDQSDNWLAIFTVSASMIGLACVVYLCFDRPVRNKLRRIADSKLARAQPPWTPRRDLNNAQ